jgi:hypothetical protein
VPNLIVDPILQEGSLGSQAFLCQGVKFRCEIQDQVKFRRRTDFVSLAIMLWLPDLKAPSRDRWNGNAEPVSRALLK